MNRLLLVRHAEPEIDPERPAETWPLSVAGRAACVDLAAALDEYEPDLIVTSRQRKAFETGRIMAENLYISVSAHDDLEEMRRAGVGWLASTDFHARLEEALSRPDETLLGDESAADALARFESALRAVVSQHSRQNVVVVTHGTVMSLFLAPLAGVQPYAFWRQLGLPAFAVLKLPDMSLERVVASVG